MRLCEYSTPATPAKNEATTKAVILVRVTLTPIASAAMRLSLAAFIFLPVFESIKLRRIIRVISVTIKHMANVESLGVPVIPCAPFISSTLVAASEEILYCVAACVLRVIKTPDLSYAR